MYTEVKLRYGFSSWRKNVDGASTSFIGFDPMKHYIAKWPADGSESFANGGTFELNRSRFSQPNTRNARVRIDSYYTPSEADAREALISILAHNQLPILARGPEDIGEVSFVDFAAAPTYVCWVRGNMCLIVSSFGRHVVTIFDWARTLDHSLDRNPDSDEMCLSLSPEISPVKMGMDVMIDYSVPWQLSDQCYLKFRANGGRLSVKGKRLYLSAESDDVVIIHGLAFEPGHETCRGTVVIATT